MPATRNAAGLWVTPLDEPEPWLRFYDANWAQLAAANALGGLAVLPRDVDYTTLLATSLYYTVAPGYIRTSAGLAWVAGFADRLAPAATAVNVWLDQAGALYQGAAFPTDYAYKPLARIVADAAKITSITDYRNPMVSVGGPLSVSRVAVTANYVQGIGTNYVRADATAGPLTVTLSAPANYVNQLIYIRKVDTTTNAVTIAAPAGATIDGAATLVLGAQGTAILTGVGGVYERVA